jgi:hypothetical protein
VIRRASWEDAELVEDCIYRDFARRNGAMEQFLADRMNVCLLDGSGGALFVWRGPGIYEVHVFLEQRGKDAFAVMREMFRTMRSEYGARLLWAAVPVISRHVIMFARLIGWKSQGFADLPQGRCELFLGE